MNENFKIRWENRYSHEIGFVKDVDYKNNHFINGTYEEAKIYKSLSAAKIVMKRLDEIGEGVDNIFFADKIVE